MIIDLSEDCLEEAPKDLVKEVLFNKEKGVSFRCVCSSCGNSLPVRSKDVYIQCCCGGIMKYVDNSLCEYRRKKSLSQKQLGKLLGVSRNYISMIEAGARPIPEKLKKLMAKR